MADEQKTLLRHSVLTSLRALPADYVQAASTRLREQLKPLLQAARHVCLYAPLPHEVNLLPLLQEYPECSYYFPRCLPERRLSFHRVRQPDAELEPGALGILAPRAELPAIPPAQVELIIVPGVAFTLSGKRLGYGGGYYDRFLPLLPPHAQIIALVLPEQLMPDLPVDKHDVRIPSVLTLPGSPRNDE